MFIDLFMNLSRYLSSMILCSIALCKYTDMLHLRPFFRELTADSSIIDFKDDNFNFKDNWVSLA